MNPRPQLLFKIISTTYLKREREYNLKCNIMNLEASHDRYRKRRNFRMDRCGMSFTSENQMNAHKVSRHAVAGGEITNR
ncbi:MAG: hypothetical protein M3270_05655 [Thermoproteota archaeon]|nr:hypothetical protein [Thermoproteota archaeon]